MTANIAETTFYSHVASKLHDIQCEDLKILSFLEEFIYNFALLGEDISRLRTLDDFKNFDRKTLREFFSGDLLDIIQSERFYEDAACLLGLVAVNNSPPNFHLGLPSLPEIFPSLKVFETIKLVNESIITILDCAESDEEGNCYIDNCDTIMDGINSLLHSGIDCKIIDMVQFVQFVMELVEFLKELPEAIQKIQDTV